MWKGGLAGRASVFEAPHLCGEAEGPGLLGACGMEAVEE